ncbi:dynein light chain, roadblock-type [Monocercomonoides exilis]|uniref:dynein light chain, roadblock-type n=1 Tax=Monocercomonoides exilis TaxID=2049356 RepID=UPI00355A7E09|nr:dynein light chain, roadblock-type [Monocercomonoides exilis]|eukprot:MONOS_4042.1-p1 / transcript=MONOS_4042.1 / gene=MONOS_4042 / organism=Monocercomonoides_exilis_PA203 / gene_product=dynein light chain, roadblock-type / transcript_product=dynein light chain, roadblock-type / location=Mono_scaffold00102:101624-102307(-) / protein_length=137 / sequence_SO=supercontig / SO=protein_coding / is_pseudo=false
MLIYPLVDTIIIFWLFSFNTSGPTTSLFSGGGYVSEVESSLMRINQHPGVQGILITQNDLKCSRVLATSDESPVLLSKDNYAQCCTSLSSQARTAIRDLDPTDDLKFMRIRTRKTEIMIAPEQEYTIVCVQDPTAKA